MTIYTHKLFTSAKARDNLASRWSKRKRQIKTTRKD